VKNRVERFGDHPVQINGVGAQEWRLRPHVMPAGRAMVHTYGDPQQHGGIEIQINGRAGDIPYPRSGVATAITR